jgi:bifunctional non-homologous end joining protein LigD
MLLPEPMLAKAGPLPTGRWLFEQKWDGFRAIVRSGDNYCVRSRRGWQMTELRPEFACIPVEGVCAGELVAFGHNGLPSFDRVSRRMLHGEGSIPVALVSLRRDRG